MNKTLVAEHAAFPNTLIMVPADDTWGASGLGLELIALVMDDLGGTFADADDPVVEAICEDYKVLIHVPNVADALKALPELFAKRGWGLEVR